MPERFKMVCTMQGAIQVLWFTFTLTYFKTFAKWQHDALSFSFSTTLWGVGVNVHTTVFLLPHSEDCMILSSFVWEQYQKATDRQTDGFALGNTRIALCCRAQKNMKADFQQCWITCVVYTVMSERGNLWCQSRAVGDSQHLRITITYSVVYRPRSDCRIFFSLGRREISLAFLA